MHRYHFCTSIPPLSFQNFITVFSSEFLLLNAIFNFKFFIDILFGILIACKYYTTFNVLLLCFNDRLICGFSLCRIVSVFSQKPCCVYINKSTLMQTLSSKGVLPNECSPNVQKVVEKIFLSELIFVNFESIWKSLWRWKFSLGCFVKIYLCEFLHEVENSLNETKKS